jgi:hypothetical protein
MLRVSTARAAKVARRNRLPSMLVTQSTPTSWHYEQAVRIVGGVPRGNRVRIALRDVQVVTVQAVRGYYCPRRSASSLPFLSLPTAA